MKYVYIRLSTKEDGDLTTQLKAIKKKFNLNKGDYKLISERISAYKEETQDKRKFNEIIDLINNNKVTELYIYSIDRLFRNIERTLSFYFLCRSKEVKIFSVNQEELNELKDDTPLNKFMQYQLVLIYSLQAEQESFNTSQRIKKAFRVNKKGVVVSYNNKKIGRNSISDNMRDRIKERKLKGFSAKEIQEQSDIYQIIAGKKEKIALPTLYKIFNED